MVGNSSGNVSDTQACGFFPSQQVPRSSGDGSCKNGEETKTGSLFVIAEASRQRCLGTQHKNLIGLKRYIFSLIPMERESVANCIFQKWLHLPSHMFVLEGDWHLLPSRVLVYILSPWIWEGCEWLKQKWWLGSLGNGSLGNHSRLGALGRLTLGTWPPSSEEAQVATWEATCRCFCW